MPTSFEIAQSAGAIYAESVLELATQAGQAEAVGEEMSELLELWRHEPSFASMMSSAAIDEDARRESIKKIFGGGRVNRFVLNLLLVLNDKRRAMILPQVCQAYSKRLDRQLKRSEVFVTTAVPLDGNQRSKLQQEIRRLIQREPVLVERVDPEILGGMTVQVVDRVYDTSVRRGLRELRRTLLQSLEKHLRGQKLRFVTEK